MCSKIWISTADLGSQSSILLLGSGDRYFYAPSLRSRRPATEEKKQARKEEKYGQRKIGFFLPVFLHFLAHLSSIFWVSGRFSFRSWPTRSQLLVSPRLLWPPTFAGLSAFWCQQPADGKWRAQCDYKYPRQRRRPGERLRGNRKRGNSPERF